MKYSTTSLLALAVSAAAQSRGFNYGALDLDGSPRTLQDFTDQFNAAKALPGTNGQFTSARLFTMLQAGADNQVIAAIQAAIETDTSLLLGLWGSGGQEGFNAELGALRSAIEQYGDAFTSRVVGISVGSEDLYRVSPTGIENMSGVGAGPDTIASYIGQLREVIASGPLANAPVGHVDTWTAWVNGSNSAVVEAVDWLGTDAYPYFQNMEANGIENGESLFFEAYDATVGAANGKPVWVTETGWPVEGPASNQAQASTENAQTYWRDVSCRLQGTNTNFWWFTLDDDQATSDDVSFSLVNPSDLFGTPLYDLSCSGSSSSSSASSSAPATSSAASSTVSSMVSSAPIVPIPAPSASESSIVASVNPLPGSVSSTLSSFETVASPLACPPKSSPAASAANTAPQSAAPAASTDSSSPGESPAPIVSYSTQVVPAPVGTAPAGTNAATPAASASPSGEPQTFDGGAANVAGGAAAGLAAVFAFFL